ncbi:ferredoxin [Saccharomonospora sp. NPDC046836]|uniref:ferredoxin n=1 Tax=Saccharomonospora sp. NPDC046836 TaxID=3156921 RepID=UPI003408376E
MTDRPRVNVTPETCAGTGVCSFYASSTFALDDAGKVSVIAEDGDPAEDVRNAADACPTRSIHLGIA